MRSDFDNLTLPSDARDAREADARAADARDGDTRAWRRATALVEAARSVDGQLSAEAMTRVRRDVEQRVRQGGRLILPVRRPLVVGAAALVLLSTVAAAASFWRHRRAEPVAPAAPPGSLAAHADTASRGGSRVGPAMPPLTATAEGIEPGLTAGPPAEPVPSRAADVAPRSRRTAPPAATETQARLLAQALRQIRQQHDPAAALATLDRLERRFPGGVLADEARATRIEAAVAAKDLRTATRLVEGAAIPAGRSGVAILVMRGELRAQAGRCGEAVTDFTRVLAQAGLPGGELAARALYGRAVCFQRLGQGTRAQIDAETLRREHPHSRLGREAQRLLEDDTPEEPTRP
jgi:hypothetical protein